MTVIDYTRVDFDDPRSVEPSRHPGFFGVGLDETGAVVAGRTEPDRDRPGRHRFAGPTISAEALGRFGEGGWAGSRSNFLQLDDARRLRGDKVARCLHELRKPEQLLQVGDAVMIDGVEADRPFDARVLVREGDRLFAGGDWYDADGTDLTGGPHELISTTTMAGDQPYGELNGQINARMFLIRDRVEQWNPHNPQMAAKAGAWRQRLDTTSQELASIEVDNGVGPTFLVNAASDLNLADARLDRWMDEVGARPAQPRDVTAELSEQIRSRAAELDYGDEEGYQPGA